MASPPDVEFASDDGDPGTGDELLTIGQRPSRWPWVALLALVGVAVGVVVADRGGSHHAATPSRSVPATQVTTAVTPTPLIGPVPLPEIGHPLPLPTTAPALALDTTDSSTWVLQPRHITLVDVFHTVVATASWPGVPPGASALLQVDTIANEVWVVVTGTPTGRVFEYSAFTLTPKGTINLSDIGGAAALYGHLYVSSAGRLIDIEPRAAPRVIGRTRDQLGPVVADLARLLVLVVDVSFPTHVWRYRVGHQLMPTPLILPITKVSVGVTSHGDWIGGFAHGPMLWHLPSTADRVTEVSALNRQLAPGAIIVAAGRDVFWVRAGTPDSADLWCVSAATGRIAQHWVIPGPVASTSGVAVIGTSTGAAPLNLNTCQG